MSKNRPTALLKSSEAKVLFSYAQAVLWVKLKPVGVEITELSFFPMCYICILLSLPKEMACSENFLTTIHLRKKERERE